MRSVAHHPAPPDSTVFVVRGRLHRAFRLALGPSFTVIDEDERFTRVSCELHVHDLLSIVQLFAMINVEVVGFRSRLGSDPSASR